MSAVDLTRCRIVVANSEATVVKTTSRLLSEDIERVYGVRPRVDSKLTKGQNIVITTVANKKLLKQLHVDAREIEGCWERYKIFTTSNSLIVVGSDARGAAYGALHISEKIGVSPWYWFADVPVAKKVDAEYTENYVSKSPSVKYRGIFINDEDWGLKTWSSNNYEKELGDIGPKTYARVCELILRLKGNMLAPAMHTCTGAFYSHPESQKVADEYGIMITTSHCEPLLFNNASPDEWTKERDGEWNYVTNRDVIWNKLNDRVRETAQYDNIYTMGMRGLHDEAMKGSKDPSVRARTLEKVMKEQRDILYNYKVKQQKAYATVDDVPQIFVPYKETLDIYDAGLRVPEDITIVWPDDNYGYMKRVSCAEEQKRSGASGVYYHLSYLGTPHDYLWVPSTAPVLMYEEVMKAYRSGGNRYWLLNVGDIKPMEVETQTFFDLAYDTESYDIRSVNDAQPQWLASIFGAQYLDCFRTILDEYYRLAWVRRPEFMGYEIEWDNKENERLHDTEFSFSDGTAQKRLKDYERISKMCDSIQRALPSDSQPSFFELLSFSVKAAEQMNVKFLQAQLNHETGDMEAAKRSMAACDSIDALMNEYNSLLGGKWNQMMSEVPPGFVAQYQQKPEYVTKPTEAFKLPSVQLYPDYANKIDLSGVDVQGENDSFSMVRGIGCDWCALQLGDPFADVQDAGSLSSSHLDIPLEKETCGDTIKIRISTLPMWPVYSERSNRFGVSIDGSTPQVCENEIVEWSDSWKLQVLANRKDYVLQFPVDRSRKQHILTIVVGDPGQYIQSISYE